MKNIKTFFMTMALLAIPSISFAQNYDISIFEVKGEKVIFHYSDLIIEPGQGYGTANLNNEPGMTYGLGNLDGKLNVKISDATIGLEYKETFTDNAFIEVDDHIRLLIRKINDPTKAVHRSSKTSTTSQGDKFKN